MKILGHRGIITIEGDIHQNSLTAFELAFQHGDGIETDVCHSSDNELFLIHEAKYFNEKIGVEYCLEEHLDEKSRKLVGGRRLHQMTAKEIKKLCLLSGEKIPTLKQTLALLAKYPYCTLNLELKSNDVHKALVPFIKNILQIKSQIQPEQIIISSFNHQVLSEVRTAFPSLKLGMIFIQPELKPTKLFPWKKNSLATYTALTKKNLSRKLVSKIRPEFIVIPDAGATPKNLQLIKKNLPYARIMIWTFTELDSYNPQALQNIINQHSPSGFLYAVIVDTPHNFSIGNATNIGNKNNGEPFDICIIGGGINGCGIARESSGRGLKTFLCDKGSLGGETSSASSGMIHGGLRYLEFYEFNLVRKALKEQTILMKLAPHIIREQRFTIPHTPELRPAWLIRCGLFLYDFIHPFRATQNSQGIKFHHKNNSKSNNKNSYQYSPLKKDFTQGFLYSDCIVDDARLVILNALDAKKRGANIQPHTEFKSAKINPKTGLWEVTVKPKKGQTYTIIAKSLVNATGPWASAMLALILKKSDGITSKKLNGTSAKPTSGLKLIKGSHIVVARISEQAFTFQLADGRVIFALPYQEKFTLIGTTEEEISGDPSKVKASQKEIKYLCKEASNFFKKAITPKDVIHAFAGVRPLLDDGNSDAKKVSRDYQLELIKGSMKDNNPPILNIWSGKITTYRILAETAVDSLAKLNLFKQVELQHKNKKEASFNSAKTPLAGGNIPANYAEILKQKYPWLPTATAERYARSYGSLCEEYILTNAKRLRKLGKHFGAGLYAAEVDYLITHEWAATAEETLWKHTKLGLVMTPKETKELAKYLKANL